MNNREQLVAVATLREEQQKQQTSEYDWLKKAKPEEIVLWLAREVPFGSKVEALAKIRQLEAAVKENVPEASEAIRMIGRLAAALEAAADGRPVVSPPGDLLDTTVEVWQHIQRWTSPRDSRRFLARFGDATCRLERADNGALGTMVLDQKRMINLLSRVARWGFPSELGLMFADLLGKRIGDLERSDLLAGFAKLHPPPPIVAQNVLADAEHPLPRLERVTEVPVLAPDGSVHDRPGYDPSSRCFYESANGLKVPRIPKRPGENDVDDARSLILDELLVDFKFVSDAERAHAVCFMIEPFVRVMIKGSTPLYLFEAPTPGTGKTLLAECLAVPTLGERRLELMAEARDPDEWRKRLTSKLRTAPAFLVIDNVKRPLESGPLAMMLTAGVVEDRLLGVSEMVSLPVRCTIAATANNVQLSDEMTRRVVRSRQDTGMENPEEREGFRNELPAWAHEHRGKLIWAVLTLARAWVAEGCPAGPEKPLGSFESWTRVMGGILKVAGIDGMLTNLGDVRAQSRDSEHADFLHAVYKEFKEAEFMAADVAAIARSVLRLGDVGHEAAALRVGHRLRSMVDRPMGGLVLRRGPSTHHGGRKWQVLCLSGRGSSPASPASPASGRKPPGSTGGVAGDVAGDANGSVAHPPHDPPPFDGGSGGFAGDAGDAGDKPGPHEPESVSGEVA